MYRKAILQHLKALPFEALIWLTGLIILAFSQASPENHFTICPLALSGFDWCPGCGLGRSVSYLFEGEIRLSFATHPLGIPAVIILTFRIIQLLKHYIKSYGTNH
jgi:hypothetical protein